jgi:magnesium-transporting ATPase (P-type)
METVSQNVLSVVTAVVMSLLFMVALNRTWPAESRRSFNDLVGWELTVIGTTYAVILGFMLYAVWTTYGEAELNVDLEAAAISDLYHLADLFPQPQQSELKNQARSYADAVVNREWAEMAHNQEPQESLAIISEMWQTVKFVPTALPTAQTAQDHALSELSSLTQHRLVRLTQSTTKLTNVLWCLLLVAGALTIVSACMFGMQKEILQTLQVLSLSLLVSLSLVAIADIHRPFQGVVHVRGHAFERALQSMKSE